MSARLRPVEKRERLIHNQSSTIKAFTTIVEAGRKAGLAPLSWRLGSSSPTLLGDVDMLVWQPDRSASDGEATAAARLAAFNGWAALVERLTERSIEQYGHHPSGGSMLTTYKLWEPRDTGISIEHRAFAAKVSIDVDRRYCAWLISLGIRTTVDKPSRAESPLTPATSTHNKDRGVRAWVKPSDN
jgi:hypothetical protein